MEFVSLGARLLYHTPTMLVISIKGDASTPSIVDPEDVLKGAHGDYDRLQMIHFLELMHNFHILRGQNYIPITPTSKLISLLPPERVAVCGECEKVCFSLPLQEGLYEYHTTGFCTGEKKAMRQFWGYKVGGSSCYYVLWSSLELENVEVPQRKVAQEEVSSTSEVNEVFPVEEPKSQVYTYVKTPKKSTWMEPQTITELPMAPTSTKKPLKPLKLVGPQRGSYVIQKTKVKVPLLACSLNSVESRLPHVTTPPKSSPSAMEHICPERGIDQSELNSSPTPEMVGKGPRVQVNKTSKTRQQIPVTVQKLSDWLPL